mgnify:CR=1 FL=1
MSAIEHTTFVVECDLPGSPRHAFRFWMGRNETLNDAPVLQAAHRAYRDNGGSMKALVTSLLTSDAFLYRKVERAAKTEAK